MVNIKRVPPPVPSEHVVIEIDLVTAQALKLAVAKSLDEGYAFKLKPEGKNLLGILRKALNDNKIYYDNPTVAEF